jgi:type VI secretion system protein ImpM
MTGFWGKIPSRGDFVGSGLARDAVAAWDGWVSAALAASQGALGEAWMPAWMEAPVWCFAAAPGCFGRAALAGLWMPSADRAGRAFPLLIATDGAAGAAWLAAAEDAGRAALADLLEPEALAARLPGADAGQPAEAGSAWWTEGSPRVKPCRLRFAAVPGPGDFARMLDEAA